MNPRKLSRSIRLASALAALLAYASLAASGASASGPALSVVTNTPDYVTAGKSVKMVLSIQNDGDQPLSGNLIVKYTFPEGIAPVDPFNDSANVPDPSCVTTGQLDECNVDVTGIQAGTQVRFKTSTVVDLSASGTLNGQVEVSGGGTAADVTEPFSMIVGPSGPFAIKDFHVGIADPTKYPSSQAGADPTEVKTDVKLLSEAQTNFDFPSPNLLVIAPTESFRDVVVHVPPGFIGNPTATPLRCTAAQLTTPVPGTVIPSCPAESQIGVAQLVGGDIVPVYNVQPPLGHPAEFGFFYESIVITLLPRIRPSDNGIDIVTEKAPSSIPIPKFSVSLWGIPGDSSHDHLRTTCLQGHYGYNGGNCALKTDRVPFLRTPTSCTGSPLPWGIEVDTYQHPGAFVHKETTTPATTGCDVLPFDPSISLTPDSRGAHAPTGLDVDLTMPQDTGPDGLAEADVRAATVTLPQGVAVNPGSADGLAACTDAQLRLGLEGPSDCPDASKLGTVEVTTPLLDHTLGGSVFLRSQASNDPESGDLYRLAIELRSDRYGLAIKLPGSLTANAATGQLTTSFSDLPQLPFESMQLHFKTGPRAPLSTPSTCGTYNTHATLTSWSGKVVQADSPFTVDQNCSAPAFDPGFNAGVVTSTAGVFSPFSLRVTRDDGMPNIGRIDTTLPEGELAKLAGVPLCPEADAPRGACPASSRIGTTTVGAGSGSSPLYLPQAGKAPTAVYLAGPYKGGPYSVVVKVPAQAGPFDLGTVAVRSALQVDPTTTRVTVASDPLPQIIGGVPVSYRDIRVDVDRPGFTINPTSCEPMAATGAIASTTGQVANVSTRFQMSDCAGLAFKPKLALTLRGGTTRGRHPALRATLTMPKRGADIARASVALPHSEFLAQDHIRTICTRVQFAAGGGGGEQCPPGSVYGHATATSPLLDRPLSGPVFLRSSSNPLPDLVVALDGQIHVDLVGRIDSKNGGIRTTFATVPDAPVTKFVLSMQGGKKGLLENSTNLCAATKRATAEFDAQNGKIHDLNPVLRADCGKKTKRK